MTDEQRPPTNALGRALWEIGQQYDTIRDVDVAELAKEAVDRHRELRGDAQ